MPFLSAAAAACVVFLVTGAVALQQPRPYASSCCLPHERDALLVFKQAITSDPAGILASWPERDDHHRHEQDCCRNKTGHVLELDLRNVLILEDDEYGYPLVNGLHEQPRGVNRSCS
ncbi:hypothetical protein HU200_047061 [Digitaria exilis]|uniref:Leucine-rich repeat-containing N-terminal plant-type domain-containing protein n=1 Tax=Digitaria exilis TaxID=1010633 RepID=A0A835ED91_9POAL|nr:hypothetical protein HU200_047061 [Digitaria exilis]